MTPEEALEQAKTVTDLYGQAATDLLVLIATHLAEGITSPAWARERLAAVLKLRAATQARVARLQAEGPASGADAVRRVYDTVTGEPGVNHQAVEALAADLQHRLTGVVPGVLRWVEDEYRAAVAEAAGPLVVGVIDRREAAARVVDRLTTQGVGSFTDTAGRTWRLDTYAEMATRAAVGRAHLAGTVHQYTAEGYQWVVVSDSPEECGLCLVPGTVVEGPAPTWRSRLEYRGDVVTITTASGKDLTGTPEHPVLTPLGWRRLQDLRPGDQVISHDGQQRYAGVMPDDVQVPALIEEAGEARAPLLLAGPTRRDLDQGRAYREVRAVFPDGYLLPEGDTPLSEPVRHQLLVGAVGPGAPLLGLDDALPDLVGHGASGALMGRFEHGGALLGGGLVPPPAHGLAPLLGEDLGGECVQCRLEMVAAGAAGVSGSAEVVEDRPIADIEGGTELLHRLAGQVAPDEVLTVGRREFRGHVWDLSTEPAWFVANGIVTHNCRPFEGRILSLAGDTPPPAAPGWEYAGTLAGALARGFGHPGCTHRLSPYVPGLTRPPAWATAGRRTENPDGYEVRQRQRLLERRVRESKRRVAALAPLGGTAALQRTRATLRARRDALAAHVAAHDRKRWVSDRRTQNTR